MELERLYDPTFPESTPTNSSLVARRIGGYLMGDMSRALAVSSITALPLLGILAPPIGVAGAIASAYVSRRIYRPTYQSDEVNNSILKKESRTRKVVRMALSTGGVALMGIGFGVFATGIVNIFGSAHSAIPGLLRMTAGYYGMKYGNRTVRGSFDPELFEDKPVTHESPSPTETQSTDTATQPAYEYVDADFEGYTDGPLGVEEMNEDLQAEYDDLLSIATSLSDQERRSRMQEITGYYRGLMQAHLDREVLATI